MPVPAVSAVGALEPGGEGKREVSGRVRRHAVSARVLMLVLVWVGWGCGRGCKN